jgi:hypothetical protein
MAELKIMMLERQLVEQRMQWYLELAMAKRGLSECTCHVDYSTGEIRVS